MPRMPISQFIILIAGFLYTTIGLTMLIMPRWFYENLGHFPPYNRHYIGDLATFILPIGGGLLLATKAPTQHRLLLWVVGVASLLHSLNHIFDAMQGAMSLQHWLTDTIPLIIGASLLLYAIWLQPSRGKSQERQV